MKELTLEDFTKTLEGIQESNAHLTPTINDVFDTFFALGIKVDRTDPGIRDIVITSVKENMHKKQEAAYLLGEIIKKILNLKEEESG